MIPPITKLLIKIEQVVKDINAACLPNKSRLLQALHR